MYVVTYTTACNTGWTGWTLSPFYKGSTTIVILSSSYRVFKDGVGNKINVWAYTQMVTKYAVCVINYVCKYTLQFLHILRVLRGRKNALYRLEMGDNCGWLLSLLRFKSFEMTPIDLDEITWSQKVHILAKRGDFQIILFITD